MSNPGRHQAILSRNPEVSLASITKNGTHITITIASTRFVFCSGSFRFSLLNDSNFANFSRQLGTAFGAYHMHSYAAYHMHSYAFVFIFQQLLVPIDHTIALFHITYKFLAAIRVVYMPACSFKSRLQLHCQLFVRLHSWITKSNDCTTEVHPKKAKIDILKAQTEKKTR